LLLTFLRICLAICLLQLLASVAVADLKLSKDNYRHPILRTFIFNPDSFPNRCERREYNVRHRRDTGGKPYAIKVTPLNGAEEELIPAVAESFLRWRFAVPPIDDWKDEFLSNEHENVFWTKPPNDCPSKTYPE